MNQFYTGINLQNNFLENAKLKRLSGTEASQLGEQVLFFDSAGNLCYKLDNKTESLVKQSDLINNDPSLIAVKWDDFAKRWVYRSFVWPDTYFSNPLHRVQWIPVNNYLLDTSHFYGSSGLTDYLVNVTNLFRPGDFTYAGSQPNDPSISVDLTNNVRNRLIVGSSLYVFNKSLDILEGKFRAKIRTTLYDRNYYYVSGFWSQLVQLNTLSYFSNNWPNFYLWLNNQAGNNLVIRMGLVYNNTFYQITSFDTSFELLQNASYTNTEDIFVDFNYRILLNGQCTIRLANEWGERFYQSTFVPSPDSYPDTSTLLHQRVRFGVGRFGLSGVDNNWSNIGFAGMGIWKTRWES